MRRAFLSVTAVAVLLLSGACGGTTPAAERPSSGPSAAYPATVGKVTLDRRPEKIVSLSPTATEMLFAIGAGPQVTAVDDRSDYPVTAPRTSLSGYKPSAEAIAARNPDLVVLSDDIDKIVAQLERLKIPVLLVPAATSMDDTYREMDELGTLTGHPGEAVALHQRMAADIDRIVRSVPPRSGPLTYYYELDPTFYTVTSKTFIGSIFTMFGMTNVADAADPTGAKGGYPQLAQEALITADPDTIFLADGKCCRQSAQTVSARTGWKTVTAVRSGQIYTLDDDIASRWGPRTVDLVRAVADAVVKVKS
jgi:iron complex transport system substrate-binding protein